MNLTELLRDALRPKVELAPAFDSADAAEGEPANYVEQDIALKALSAVHEWAMRDDLDVGESFTDRLLMLMVGVADENKDGEISEDEQALIEIALNAVFDYMVEKGVPEDDAGALLNDWDADAGDRVRELLNTALSDDDDEAMSDIDGFIFGAEAQSSLFDSAKQEDEDEDDDEDDDDEDDPDGEKEWANMPEDEDEDKALDGDFRGHPFRGNQYRKASRSSGAAVSASSKAKKAEKHGSKSEQKKAHKAAYHAHASAASQVHSKGARKYHRKMAKLHGKKAGMDKVTLDSIAFDATYKKRIVFRAGKKIRVNKRVSGTVRRTAKQKQATRKASMKSHNAAAMMKRAKSMRMRRKAGF